MTWGWAGAVGCTVVLAIIGDTCTVETWLGLSIATQAFMMLADVPADGYSVELGQLEAENERGVILSTGQFVFFLDTMCAGVIQATMVNGVSTNASDCEISALKCWSWGLTVGQYYRVLAVIFAVLALPIFFMREVSSDHIPLHSFAQHGHALLETLQNPTTL
jgi:MFS family permease